MKILYVTRELPYGMAEAHILPEMASHREYGWDVWIAQLKRTVMTHHHGPALLAKTFDEPLISPRVVLGALVEFARSPLKALDVLGQFARSRTPKNFIQNCAAFPKGLWLAGVVRRARFAHIHVHWAGAPTTYAAIAALLSGTPYSMTAHRYDIAQRNLLPWKARNAQFVRVIDNPGADEFQAALGPGGRRPIVLHVGVQLPPALAPRRSGRLDVLKVVVGARFVEKKGHSYLIEGMVIALRAGVTVDLTLYGDGPLEADLRALATKLGVAHCVHFEGPAAHEALLSMLRGGQFDIAALPSVTGADGDKEGIPVFLMESMAAGVPVLTTPNGGILELAGDGAGYVVPERDSVAIGEGFIKLAGDAALREQLALAGRERVQSDFEVETCIGRLREMILGAAPAQDGADAMNSSVAGTSA